MSPIVKHLCKIRNGEIRRGIDESQERINNLIRKNQIRAVYDEKNKHRYGTKGWWKLLIGLPVGIHLATILALQLILS